MKQMNLGEDLAPHNNTESFVNKFKKYIKMVNICDSAKLTNCFTPVITKSTGEEVKTETLTTSTKLGKEYNDNNMSITLIDGTSLIMTYNSECEAPDKYKSLISTSKCLGYIVDLNGNKNPNTVGKDIILYNVTLPGAGCNGIQIEDLCVASADIDYEVGAVNESWDIDQVADFQLASYNSAKSACASIGMKAPDYYQLIVMSLNMDKFTQIPSMLANLNNAGISFAPDNMDEFHSDWNSLGTTEKDYNTSGLYYYSSSAPTAHTEKVRCVQ